MKKKYHLVPAIFLILLITLTASQHAHAEGVLIAAEPKEGSEVSGFNGKISLWFSGNITQRTPTLIVFDEHGNRVDEGKPKLKIAPRSELSVTTRMPLPAGAYVARYRVLTRDGLVVGGIYKFTIKS